MQGTAWQPAQPTGGGEGVRVVRGTGAFQAAARPRATARVSIVGREKAADTGKPAKREVPCTNILLPQAAGGAPRAKAHACGDAEAATGPQSGRSLAVPFPVLQGLGRA